jgi:hypothetical protein
MSVKSKFTVQEGVGASSPIKILESNDIKVSYAVEVVGSVIYTVQHNLSGTAYFDNADNENRTTSKDGNYVFPIDSVRVNVTAGTGTATLFVMQLVV